MATEQTPAKQASESLLHSPLVRTERLTIKSYDVDAGRVATIEALCRYFLEAAWNHAENLGVGFGELARQNKVWVLSRLLVCIERYPRWGEEVILTTWPRGRESVFALRDFEFRDSKHAKLAGGTASWLVLDLKTRRPQRIEKLVATIPTEPKRATDCDASKLELPQHPTTTETDQTNASSVTAIRVQYSDEDLNGHVNSASYIRWLMDTYDRDWHRANQICRLEINYVGECRTGDEVSLSRYPIRERTFFHTIGKSEAEPACRAVLQWEKRQG